MRKNIKIIAVLAAIILVFVSCGDKNKGGGSSSPKKRAKVESTELQFLGPQAGDTIAVIETSKGTVKAVIYTKEAPQAAENFIGLANNGYFDGLEFHRIVKDFVIQTGDDSNTGSGGATIWQNNPYPVELSDKLRHFSGALGIAHVDGDLNGNLSQFYIVETPQTSVDKNLQDLLTQNGERESVVKAYAEGGGAPHLDGTYTVFGQVFEGLDVVDDIGYTTNETVTVTKITIETFN